MRIGVKFAREGFAKYISHLDIQNMFSRILRRTGLPVSYSQGFNPHIHTSFASAMAVGLETRGDYMEFYTDCPVKLADVEMLLERELPDDFSIIRVGEIPADEKKLMALVEQAEYEIIPDNGAEIYADALRRILSMEHCMAEKARQGKKKEIDIRPLIFDARADAHSIRVRLALSGTQSLNPAFLMEKVSEIAGRGFSGRIIRLELYCKKNDHLRALDILLK